MDAAVIWTAVGALGTLAAAAVAAWAARQSREAARQSNESAKQASAAAGALAAIERDRRHEELAPEFEVIFFRQDSGHAQLKVTLSGGRLEYLDQVTVTILDEAGKEHWGDRLPPRVTQDEAQAFVWGPYEFLTAASVQIATNRQSRPRPYSRVTGKNWDLLPLTPTQPGHWMGSSYTQERWQEDFAGQPVRLLITCHREGYDPWTVLEEAKILPRPRIRVLED